MKHRFFSTDITARFSCVLFLTFMSVAALTSPTTVPGRVVAYEGHWTLAMFVAVLIIAGAIFVDVVVNSLMSDRYKWDWIKSRRDLVYLAGGMISLAPSYYIAKKYGMNLSSSILYLGMPTLIFHLACCDIKAKHKGARRHEAG